MLYKDIKCKDVKNCTYCPYGAEALLKVCLSIKLDEKLGEAVNKLDDKEILSKKVNKVKYILEQEVKY